MRTVVLGWFPKPHQGIRPYFFSEQEVTGLLGAASGLKRVSWSPLRPEVFRLPLVLLFTTGIRRGELLRLILSDYDGPNAILLIRESKFHKSRLLPLSGYQDYGRLLSSNNAHIKVKRLFAGCPLYRSTSKLNASSTSGKPQTAGIVFLNGDCTFPQIPFLPKPRLIRRSPSARRANGNRESLSLHIHAEFVFLKNAMQTEIGRRLGERRISSVAVLIYPRSGFSSTKRWSRCKIRAAHR